MRQPELVILDDLTELLVTRDAVCAAWRAGVMDPELAQARLRALGTRDAGGAWWRLRPGPHGAVLIRIGADGGVEIANPAEYLPPPRRSRWRQLTIGAAGLLWVVVLVRYLNGVG